MTIAFYREAFKLGSNCQTPDRDWIYKTICDNLGGKAMGFYCSPQQVEKRKEQSGDSRPIFLQQPGNSAFSWMAFDSLEEFGAFCKAYDCMPRQSPIQPGQDFQLLLPRNTNCIYPVTVKLGEDWETWEKMNITHFRHRPSGQVFVATLDDLLDMIRAIGGTPGSREQWQITRLIEFYQQIEVVKKVINTKPPEPPPTIEQDGRLWYVFPLPSGAFSIEGQFTEQYANGTKSVSHFKTNGTQLLVR